MLARLWRFVVLFARVSFACRVSLLSALGGLVLFGLVLQAQNLFADLAFANSYEQGLHWLLFFVAVFFVWAFPVHFGARKILEEDGWLASARIRRALSEHELLALQARLRKEMRCLIDWLPRILGALPFVAIAFGLFYADRAMDGASALPQARRAHEQILWLGAGDLVTGVLFILFVYWRRPLVAHIVQHFDGPPQARVGKAKGTAESFLDLLAWASVVITAGAFVVAYLRPHELAEWIPRALLVPFLFGSLVLLLSLLVRCGYSVGFPVVATLIFFCLLVTATNTHFNDLRTRPVAGPAALGLRQIEVKEAVARWREANSCAGDDCPAALIVAAEGGASRAAFMEATLIGEIIDRTRGPSDAAPGRKIFAISGVSGGAFGGATIRAALADAAESGGAPPCMDAPDTWFGVGKGKRAGGWTWRSCLQALVSGDYLSSGFIGLGFRDNFAPRKWFVGSSSWIDDRAALLEQSWERHYNRVASAPEAKDKGASCGADSNKGLCRRLGYAAQDGAGGWVPLLALNGTSVETGRRIIAADLVSTTQVKDNKTGAVSRVPLYSAAFDLFELMSTPCAGKGAACPQSPDYPGDAPLTRDAPDVLLSTAALVSARFPVISPAGILYVRGDDGHGDRMVDGGYFENAGMTTALDIAEAIRSEGVTPAILWVQNDPVGAGDITVTPPRPAATPSVGTLDQTWTTRVFGVLAAPVDALIATREGHGAEAADLAVQTLARINGVERNGYFSIGVKERPAIGPALGDDPDFERDCGALVTELAGKSLSMTKVSMSWWLSAAIQADLDAQICDSGNRSGLNDLVKILAKGK